MAFLKYFIVGLALCTYTYVYGFTNPLLYTRYSDTKVEMNANSTDNELHQKVPMDVHVIENELSKIVGLNELKMQLRKWLKGVLLDERRRALGLEIGPRRLPQLAFLGNPGTGKTMVARRLGKLLHMVGVLPKDNVIELRRTDFVAPYSGQTGILTRHEIQEAEGGILFVDKAHRLNDDFGLEALEEIMSCMDNGKVVVIFAGYTESMKRVILSNEGIRRRLSNIFHFDDFSCEQLAKILHLKVASTDENSPFYGFKLDPDSTSVEEVAALIETETSAELRSKMNGGLVDQMLVKARENLDSRIDVECTDDEDSIKKMNDQMLVKGRENLDSRIDVECADEESMVVITSEDLSVGLRLLRDEENRRNHHHVGMGSPEWLFPFMVTLSIFCCLFIIGLCIFN